MESAAGKRIGLRRIGSEVLTRAVVSVSGHQSSVVVTAVSEMSLA